MMMLNILTNVLLVILLLIHIFWIRPKLKFIDHFLKAYKDIGTIYGDFFANFKKWKEELEDQSEKLRKKHEDLENHFSKVRKLLGNVPPEKIPDELERFFNEITRILKKTDEVITLQENRIKELEKLVPKRRNIAREWLYQALMHAEKKNKKT